MYEKICNACPHKETCDIEMMSEEPTIIDGEEYIQICEVSYNLLMNMFGDNCD